MEDSLIFTVFLIQKNGIVHLQRELPQNVLDYKLEKQM